MNCQIQLSIRDLCVRYGLNSVLNQLSFDLLPGEVMCIIGPNGSGKSTLIKTLAGIISSHTGSIAINGASVDTYSKNHIAQLIGYVPQDFQFLTSITVLEAVILGRRPHVGWSLTSKDLQIVQNAMEKVQISSMAEKLLTELSGGERQRVFIARALAQEPRIFLFDEPTSALDIRHQIEVFSMIREISQNQGRSVLVAVHDLNFAYHYANRVMLIDEGKIMSIGSAEEVMTEENIRSVYGVSMQLVNSRNDTFLLPVWDHGNPSEPNSSESSHCMNFLEIEPTAKTLA
ncbi:MAG: ABC transporter ATP-binding protein [Methanospirillum sp.]|uniref:ABC transporter ATP-binding protein n=1 Tax=Methanospirillum sp. TaxID=45200 RepID=UPI00237470DA|nr:ABC transporter ATP-binding protein [Methanospirillum sp.]MDD1728757.1 ABC transporter ATP-binding protein [Methanospirillum sp.]